MNLDLNNTKIKISVAAERGHEAENFCTVIEHQAGFAKNRPVPIPARRHNVISPRNFSAGEAANKIFE